MECAKISPLRPSIMMVLIYSLKKVARALVDAQIEAINIAALSSVAGMSVATTVGESVVVYEDDTQAQQDQLSDSETDAEAITTDEDDKEADRTEPDTEPLPGGGSEEFDDGSEEGETPTS